MYRILLIVLVVTAIVFSNNMSENKVVFLDVGQGDAILFQDGSVQVLIDGGPGMKVLSELGKQMPWFDKKIEVIILTHPQRDHMEGLLHVLDRYEVGLILIPKVAASSLMQEEWLQRIIQKDIRYRFAESGQLLSVGDMQFQILGPFNSDAAKAAIKANINNASVMTRVDYCPEKTCLSFLLTGDAEKRMETMLVNNTQSEILNVNILKVGHHGSNSSTHEQLLQAVKPQAAVISVGADNKFGHPRDEVLTRLGDIPIWRTDEKGAIKFSYLDGQWMVK